jgi:ribonuclease P protein subunit POP4
MPLTPETLVRHELVGLDVEAVDAANADTVGISGSVVMETTEMLTIERADRVWHVPKDDATFVFTLDDGQRVRVEGERLVARPARRTANAGDSKWR